MLGNITSEDGIYAYENTLKNIEAKPYNELAGGSTVDTIGSMQAIWCDNPSKEHDMDRVLTLMDAFSEETQRYFSETCRLLKSRCSACKSTG